MPRLKVPINEKPYKNIDSSELSSVSDALINGYINEANDTIGFPGTVFSADLGTTEGVDGLFWWNEGNMRIQVSNGSIFKIVDGTTTDLTGATLELANKVSFVNSYYAAEDKNYLFMANGKKIIYTDGTDPTKTMADGNAPITVTSLASIDGFLIANDDVKKVVKWTTPDNPFEWEGENFIRPSIQGDQLVSIIIDKARIYLYGQRTVEPYYVTGGTIPFSRVRGAALQSGLLAINSLAQGNNTLVWMNERREIVQLNGNTPQLISADIDDVLRSFSKVDDARGFSIKMLGREFYVLTLPSGNQTWVYDFVGAYWFQLARWDVDTGSYDQFTITDYTYAIGEDKHFVGSPDAGVVYQLSQDIFDYDGNPRRILKRTGWVDHNTSNRKLSKLLEIRVKRGFGQIRTGRIITEAGEIITDESGVPLTPEFTDDQKMEENATMQIRWRDDGRASWGNYHEIRLRNFGSGHFYGKIHRPGSYRARQYEIVYAGATDFRLIEMEEDVEGAA